MALPKRRTSHSRKNKRRSHHALTAASVNNCANCGVFCQPHRVCQECGFYKGHQVAPAAE